jgi:PAS domain S-box-containing protein
MMAKTSDKRQNKAQVVEELESLRQQVAELQEQNGRERSREADVGEGDLLRTLIDSLPDCVYAKDREGRFILANVAQARYVGAEKPDELIGKSDLDFYPPELASQYHADEQAIIESDESLLDREEVISDPQTGEETWIATSKMPLRDEAGNIIGTYGISRDITAHKRVEEALIEERNLLRALIDNVPDRIYAKDTESRFIVCNKALVQRMRVGSLDDVVGKTDFDFVPPELAAQFRADEERVMQSGEPMINREEPIDSPDGRMRWNLATKVPLRDSQGKIIGIVGIGREITELKRAEEALKHRAVQLQAAAEVARDAGAILDVNQLLHTTVHLISQRFGFYHAGVFLLDEPGEYAVLCAASSEGGRRMLERGHRLEAGRIGIVGYVAGTGEPRVALDVGKDAVFFENPDLPDTRSEMALPLRFRDTVIGVLDVQSTEALAFTEEDVTTLQTMADQLAIAIENARLVERSEAQLRELSRLSGEYSQAAWADLASTGRAPGYVYDRVDVRPVEEILLPTLDEAVRRGETVTFADPGESGAVLAVPLKVRGHTIGVLGVQDVSEVREWSADERALIEAVSDQVAQALESARLFEQTQRRAHHERQVYEITSRVRRSPDIQAILQTAVDELGRALQADRALVRLMVKPRGEREGTGEAEEEVVATSGVQLDE